MVYLSRRKKDFFRFIFCLLFLFSPIYSKQAPIRISAPSDPATYDPRQARDLVTIDVIHLLFSGLTRLSHTGEVELDLAESIKASEDGLQYKISLKKTVWSDGTSLTAHDFVYTWQSILEKERACPNAFSLFFIKNASRAYKESLSLQDVGIKALSDNVLEVTLEQPCPFFLELLATPAFCAVQKKYAQGETAFTDEKPFPVSGPYKIQKKQLQSSVQLTKNDQYWAQDKQEYPDLQFFITDDATALTLFNGRQFEWVGSPLGLLPTDSISPLQKQNKLSVTPAAGTHFIRVNTKDSLLSDVRIRKALSLVLDRESLVKHVLQGGQEPAFSLTPTCLLPRKCNPCQQDKELAKELLASYCKEKACDSKSLSIKLSHAPDERNTRIGLSLQHDIESTLGITVRIDITDSKQFYSRLCSGDYEMALGSWFADYFDPHAFFSVFESAHNGTNNTKWESSLFKTLLQRSLETTDPEKRRECFYELEAILTAEVPIIPLFHATFNYAKESAADGVKLSPLGHLDITQS